MYEVVYSEVTLQKNRRTEEQDNALASTDTTYSEIRTSKPCRHLNVYPNDYPTLTTAAGNPGSKNQSENRVKPGGRYQVRVAVLVLIVLVAVSIIAVGIAFVIIWKTCSKCATGWEHHGGECYFLSNSTLTWERSRNECISRKGDLVIINSKEEQVFLEEKIRSYMDKDEDKFWIGLTDVKEEGSWLWVDESPLYQNLSFWMNGEPDNWEGKNGKGPDGEDCARMGEKGGAEDLKCWFDASCDKPHKWICETPENYSYMRFLCA